jgi:hypothetical protein
VKAASGSLVKAVAYSVANEFNAIDTATVEPGEDRRQGQGLIRSIQQNAIMHKRIDADRVDALATYQSQLPDRGLKVLDDGANGKNSGAMWIGFQIPVGFGEML